MFNKSSVFIGEVYLVFETHNPILRNWKCASFCRYFDLKRIQVPD